MKVLVDLIKRLEPKLQGALLLVHRSIMPSYQIIRYSLEKSSGTGGWKSYYKQFNLCALQWKANRMMGMKKTAGDKSGSSNYVNRSHEKTPNGDVSFHWPDAAVPAIASLEKAGHDALSSDYHKYNQKMRQLRFNLKNNAVLARRFLTGELEPPRISNMSPNE
ncbi:BAH domain [Olea europaea subsp. europaea]|uniref:BAH domain n=1 Tax=Olea europaea subsp. europaea TaxID=158383 RepID=A0A8S0SS85_OLEEU|nr:BAH domain [Olea europaea subsp. europaea]